MARRALVVTTGLLALGCGHLHLPQGDSVGWPTGYLFWPPPQATSFTPYSVPLEGRSFGQVLDGITGALRRAGHDETRVLRIGAHYEHGFAVTTRLEAIDDDGTPLPLPDRWSSRFAEAPGLRWLSGAREPRLPRAGRYRIFLLAATNLLPEGRGTRPTPWDESTVMDGPDLRPAELPLERRFATGSALSVYVYEYVGESDDEAGAFVEPGDSPLPAATHFLASGLGALAQDLP